MALRAIDLLCDAALSDRGIFALTGESTSDAVLRLILYIGEGCESCTFSALGDPANKTGAVQLPFRTGDWNGRPSPYGWLTLGHRTLVPTLAGFGAGCRLDVILHAEWPRWNGVIPNSVPYSYDIAGPGLEPCDPNARQDPGAGNRVVKSQVVQPVQSDR